MYPHEKAFPSEGFLLGLRNFNRVSLKGTYKDNKQTLKHHYYVTIIVIQNCDTIFILKNISLS